MLRRSLIQLQDFETGFFMFRESESGKTGVLLAIMVLAVVLVGGMALVLFDFTDTKDQEPNIKNDKKTVDSKPAIIDAAWEDEVEEDFMREEENEPKIFRTVDGHGNQQWVHSKPGIVHLPGKRRTIKATKVATALNRKMKPMPLKPEAAVKLQHPALSQLNKKGKKKAPKKVNKDKDESVEKEKGKGKMDKSKDAGEDGK